MKDFLIWAHRGASAEAPENTMASFRAAAAAGADGIELDVHLSSDGIPIVLHDDTLDRTTDGHGRVALHTLQELKKLDAGNWFKPAFSGEPIPTLEEVLAWAGQQLRVNIEIKSTRAGAAVMKLVGRYPSVRVLISSFDHRLLGHLHRTYPSQPLAFLTESRFWRRAVDRGLAVAARSLHPRQDLVSPALIAHCQARGIQVYPWTVDRPERMIELRNLGTAGIFTNDPAAARRCLESSDRNNHSKNNGKFRVRD